MGREREWDGETKRRRDKGREREEGKEGYVETRYR